MRVKKNRKGGNDDVVQLGALNRTGTCAGCGRKTSAAAAARPAPAGSPPSSDPQPRHARKGHPAMASKHKTRELPIQEITRGQVVQGTDGGWWRVTKTDVDIASRTVVLYARSEATSKSGWLQGPIGELRTVRR